MTHNIIKTCQTCSFWLYRKKWEWKLISQNEKEEEKLEYQKERSINFIEAQKSQSEMQLIQKQKIWPRKKSEQ